MLDWLKLILAEDLSPEDLKRDARDALPKLYGALLKNEQTCSCSNGRPFWRGANVNLQKIEPGRRIAAKLPSSATFLTQFITKRRFSVTL